MEPVPSGACDTHMHFYDARFPAAPGSLLRPPDATPGAYREIQRELGLERVVVVQPTTYGRDNRCQVEAAAAFGDAARLVVVVDEATPRSELARLHEAGARGVRFHMLPGGALGWDELEGTARRVADLGWHVQLQLNGRELPEVVGRLAALPGELVIDHFGRFMPPVVVVSEAFATLLRLVETGRCWVKLSAPYESAPDPGHRFEEVLKLARALVEARPDRLLWATNWPHPGQTDPPSASRLRHLLDEWIDDPAVRRQVLVDNPAQLYGFVSMSNSEEAP